MQMWCERVGLLRIIVDDRVRWLSQLIVQYIEFSIYNTDSSQLNPLMVVH